MKTGGSTIRKLLERKYSPESIILINPNRNPKDPGGLTPEEFKELPAEKKEPLKVVEGHIPYHLGLHHHIPKSCAYYTILRDPVELAISYYYWLVEYDPVWSGLFQDFNDWIVKDNSRKNIQVRSLTSYEIDDATATTQADVEEAKNNLRNGFGAVGITERFDETVVLLKRLMRWDTWPEYKKYNVTKNRPKRSELSEKSLELLREYYDKDFELYEFANKLLDDTIESQDESFQADLDLFREIKRRTQSAAKADDEKYASLLKNGETLSESGDYLGALQVFFQASKLAPERPEAFNSMGVLHLYMGDRKAARLFIAKALEIDPFYSQAVYNRNELNKITAEA